LRKREHSRNELLALVFLESDLTNELLAPDLLERERADSIAELLALVMVERIRAMN